MRATTHFLLWADIPPELEGAFNEWYNREHVPDRVLGVPGFIQARRFVAVEGQPKYAALYEVTGPDVFENPAYVAMRRNPDPNSRRFIPNFRNVVRFIGPAFVDASAVKGVAEGDWVRVTAFKGTVQRDAHGPWSALAAALVKRPGIVRVRVFRAVAEALDGVVRNMKGHDRESMRPPDRFSDLVAMVEAASESQLAEVEADLAQGFAPFPGLSLLDTARMRQLVRVAVPPGQVRM